MTTLGSNQPIRRRLEPLIEAPPALFRKFNATIDALNDMNPRPNLPYQLVDGNLIDGYWIRINGSSDAAYGYIEIRQTDPGKWEDVPNGQTSDTKKRPARELNLTQGIADGTRVWVSLVYDKAGDLIPVFAVASSNATFAARITASTGASHTFVEIVQTGATTWIDKVAGRTGSANEINGREQVATDERIWITQGKASDGAALYSFDIGHGLFSSPAGVGGTGAADAAMTDTWDRASPSGKGLTLTIMTRWTYNAGGDATIYGFFRELRFDSNGQLQSVSTETRQAIETPGNCEGA